MEETRRRALGLLAVVTILAVGASIGDLQAHDHSTRPVALREVDFEQRLSTQLPLNLEFHDDLGRTVRLGDLISRRPLILTLVYYSCEDLCPLTLDGLVRSLRPLSFDIGREFDVLTISIDTRDTPVQAAAKKREYLKRYGRSGADSGWHFLTGKQAAIAALTERVGFSFNREPDLRRFGHATGIAVLTPDGKISRYFYGIEYSPRDLRLGLIEAAAHKIGSPVDQLLLFCYRYDPTTGKYGLLITNVLRLGGIATVILLGSFILVMLRRERAGQTNIGGSA